jgi:hypothetical protein
MKRHEFLRHLRFHGCILKREGSKHCLYQNPANGVVEAVPVMSRLTTDWWKRSASALKYLSPGNAWKIESNRQVPLRACNKALTATGRGVLSDFLVGSMECGGGYSA